MIILPYQNPTRQAFRIVTAPSWNGGAAVWTPLPMVGSSINQNGFEVLSFSRVCLPATGEAVLRFRYGKIGGQILAPTPSQGTTPTAGWDPTKNTITFPNLRGQEIRIQMATVAGGVSAWRTVWWGTCEHQENQGWGGSAVPAGDMIYHCLDGLYRMTKWPLDRHGMNVANVPNGSSDYSKTGLCWGHPGYNVIDHSGIVRGNRDTTGATFDPTGGYGTPANGDGIYPVTYHTWYGAVTSGQNGGIWTDRQAVNHALNVCRPKNEPSLTLNNAAISTLGNQYSLYFDQPNGISTSQGQGAPQQLPVGNAWPVSPDETVWSFLNKVCRRQRGLGVVFLDYTESSGDTTGLGPLTLLLQAYPQTLGDITYTIGTPGSAFTSGTTVTLPGATNFGSAVTVDVIGDQRFVGGSLKINDREQNRVDYLESIAEHIQVAVTLSAFDTLSGTPSLFNRWQKSQENAFRALDATLRMDDGWRPVFQLYSPPHSFYGLVADHDNGAEVGMHRCDYRCDDGGNISSPAVANSGGTTNAGPSIDTSALVCRVLPDLPFLEGYDYTAYPPVRRDGQPETGTPARRPPIVLVRLAANSYLTGDQVTPNSLGLSIAGQDQIFIAAGGDTTPTGAFRSISIAQDTNLGGIYNTSQLGVTIGVELPHRMRFASLGLDFNGKAIPLSNVRRRMKVFHENLHLWLASPGCIWDINAALNKSGVIPGKRSACGGSTNAPGILRDDRGALAVRHALAYNWYCIPRRTVTWAIKDCWGAQTFTVMSDPNSANQTGQSVTSSVTYPKLGQVVSTLSANGQVQTIGTPITSVVYDNETGISTWATDWSELDFVQV